MCKKEEKIPEKSGLTQYFTMGPEMFDKLSSEKQAKAFVINISGISTSGNPIT